MKKFIYLTILTLFFSNFAVLFAQEPAVSDVWTVTADMPNWSRDHGALSVAAETLDGVSVGKAVHVGVHDWAIRSSTFLSVKPGEIFEISCRVRIEGDGQVSTGVTLYDGEAPTRWVFGGRSLMKASEWKELKSRFIVPLGTTRIMPRLTGAGEATVWFADYTIRKAGEMTILDTDETFALENDTLSVEVRACDGAFSVTDKRTGRTWRPDHSRRGHFVERAEKTPDGVSFELLDSATMTRWRATVALEKALPEIVARLEPFDPEARMEGKFVWPTPLATETERDRIILPMNEGISFAPNDPAPNTEQIHTYGGHGLCMAFWGVVEDRLEASGAGYLGIIETPDDAGVQTVSDVSDETDEKHCSPGPYWTGQKNRCGYARSVRWCFLTEGGHVALCKRYRQYAQKIGLYVPFSEKIRRNPNLADGLNRLRGAANIWCWEKDKLHVIQMLGDAGIDRILWSAGGTAEQITAMNSLPNVLTSRYDIYQDIMNPERFAELTGTHDGWIAEAWPKDIIIMEDGDWQKGWEVTPKDTTAPRIPCGVLCDSLALLYAEKRIAEELKSVPYKARFLDTTVAAPWQQCWSPEHPMTRSESRVWKMRLLALIGERFHLVCGSETGHEASVPFCDFYEGMMSLGPYRVPDSGRNIGVIWDEVPERVGKYQVGEAYRLPLWELVYHDCTVSYWYWGDYNNKLPSLWKKRDLFNALYGVPPMYLFTQKWFEEHRDRFIESWQIAGPVAYRTGRSEMTDHRILTADRSVQKTVFSDGTEVIVNFGPSAYTLPDGTTMDGESVRTNVQRGTNEEE